MRCRSRFGICRNTKTFDSRQGDDRESKEITAARCGLVAGDHRPDPGKGRIRISRSASLFRIRPGWHRRDRAHRARPATRGARVSRLSSKTVAVPAARSAPRRRPAAPDGYTVLSRFRRTPSIRRFSRNWVRYCARLRTSALFARCRRSSSPTRILGEYRAAVDRDRQGKAGIAVVRFGRQWVTGPPGWRNDEAQDRNANDPYSLPGWRASGDGCDRRPGASAVGVDSGGSAVRQAKTAEGIAVSTVKRSAAFPDVPTMQESASPTSKSTRGTRCSYRPKHRVRLSIG